MRRRYDDFLDPYFGLTFDHVDMMDNEGRVRQRWLNGIWKHRLNRVRNPYEVSSETIRKAILSDPVLYKEIMDYMPEYKFLLETPKSAAYLKRKYKEEHFPETVPRKTRKRGLIYSLYYLITGSMIIWKAPSSRMIWISAMPFLTTIETFNLLICENELMTFLLVIFMIYLWLGELLWKRKYSYIAFTEIVFFISDVFISLFFITIPFTGLTLDHCFVYLLSMLSIISISFPMSLFIPIIPMVTVKDRSVILSKHLYTRRLPDKVINAKSIQTLLDKLIAEGYDPFPLDDAIKLTIAEWKFKEIISSLRKALLIQYLDRHNLQYELPTEEELVTIGYNPLNQYLIDKKINLKIQAILGFNETMTTWVNIHDMCEYDIEGNLVSENIPPYDSRFKVEGQHYFTYYIRHRQQFIEQNLIWKGPIPFLRAELYNNSYLFDYLHSLLTDRNSRLDMLKGENIPSLIQITRDEGEYATLEIGLDQGLTLHIGSERYFGVFKVHSSDPNKVRLFGEMDFNLPDKLNEDVLEYFNHLDKILFLFILNRKRRELKYDPLKVMGIKAPSLNPISITNIEEEFPITNDLRY